VQAKDWFIGGNMDKWWSGRFWFTIAAAIVFIYGSVSRYLSGEQIVSIIMLIVSFYFSMNRAPKGDQTTEKVTTTSVTSASTGKPEDIKEIKTL
jgi:hypothetical protein